MSDCAFCDSAGIRALIELMRRTHDHGGRLVLAGSGDQLARALSMAGLDELLPSYSTVPDALVALRDDDPV